MIKMHSIEDKYAEYAKYFKLVYEKPKWKRTTDEEKVISKIIKEIPFFKSKVSLGEADTLNLIRNFRHRNYKIGENIINYGDYIDQFYIILKGKVKIMVPNKEIKNWQIKWQLRKTLLNKISE